MNIYITIDYELYLGETPGTIYNCLIHPTKRIMSILEQHNVRSTIFVDTAFMCKLMDYEELQDDYNKAYQQLSNLSRINHSIQLHIHPQWFYSSHDTRAWKMDFTHYKLSDCPLKDIEKMFAEGIKLIDRISHKKPIAFRAGGYSLQTLKDYAKILTMYNIKVDSSCLCGKSIKSKYHNYNYTAISNSNAYKFQNDICKEEQSGCLIELPITTYKACPISYLFKKLRCCRITERYGDGVGISYNYSRIRKILNRVKLLVYPLIIPASIDRKSGCVLLDTYKKCKQQGITDFTIIVHPKDTTNHSLKFLSDFLSITSKEDCKFRTVDALVSKRFFDKPL